MIKRILIIGAFTGFAHISMLFVIRKLSGSAPLSVIKKIGEIDSLFNLIISILAAGLLMTSVREITISSNWKEHLIISLKARFTLSLLMMITAIAGIYDPTYFLLLCAPVFALNPDYALYAKGRSVIASFLAFVRVVIPSGILFISSFYLPAQMITLFAISTVLMYFLTGLYTSKILGNNYFINPSLQSLKLYFETFPMGVVSFGYYFLGLGLIIPATYFYKDEKTVAISYIIIKLYVIFKSALRIINQAFISDMVDDNVCKKVDQLAILAGLAFLSSAVFFPNGFLGLFADEKIELKTSWVYLLGLTGFIISPFVSLTTKAILEKKDKHYSAISGIAIILATILIGFFALFTNIEIGVVIGLIIGEVLCIISLLIILKKTSWLKERLLFIVSNASLLIIPATIRWLGGDNSRAFFAFILLYMIAALLINKTKFGSKSIDQMI